MGPEIVWDLFVDGSSTAQASGAGLALVSLEGENIQYALRFGFKATNNEAEYEALIAGLKVANALGVEQLKVYTDSQLVAGQVQAEYEARDEKMKSYLQKVKELKNHFQRFLIHQIPREENGKADALARLATALEPEINKNIPLEYLDELSISQERQIEVQQAILSVEWADPIIRYIKDGVLPTDRVEAQKVKIRAARYTLIKGVFYKRSFSMPYLRCVSSEEADYILREIHLGVCGNHARGRSLANKAIRQGYYWPTMQKDALDFVKKCDKCQRFANTPRQPPEEMTPMSGPWPFAQWGMDLIGPLVKGKGQTKYAIVMVDYFTKWVEAKPLAKITENNIRKFVWKSIVCRFGIPRMIVTYNAKQFDNSDFKNFCSELGIQIHFSSPGHP
ncbi:uncharacterized protein LOC132316237 [Cornus florida]|uniref:uncharacterized protein LOC132316237 n=1 Tax=Cornus florida TaxID=4283 RepID=UPI00289D7E87|nr:uncharacterized protein LOC132316237 [Cornus florida]